MEVENKMSDSKKYSLDDDDEVLLPGFRFHPTDEELVGFYLRRKVEKKPLSIELIKQIDIYKHDPWDLPKVTAVGEREWYFFCRRGRKYRNSVRPNRVTGSGFWKATGIDRPVYSTGQDTHDCIGLKKSLVYYRGSAGKGTKTDWMMHEFRLPSAKTSNLLNAKNNSIHEAEVWTLCRIFKRNASLRKYVSHLPVDKSCKTCSSDSENRDNCERSVMSVTMENGNYKPAVNDHIHQRNQLFAGQLSLTTQLVPFPAPYMSFANSDSWEEFIGGENWDELRPIVDCAFDHPSLQH